MAAKFDFKAFLINHSEKVVGGIVALLVLWGFASASWEHAEVTPLELEQTAEGVRKKIMAKTVWPEDQKKAFTVDAIGKPMPDIQELAGELGRRDQEKIGFARFAMPTVWNDPLVPPREKQESVVVLAPTQAEVSSIAFPLALPLDEEDLELDGALAANDEPEVEELDPIRQRAAQRFGGDDGSGAAGLARLGQAGDIAGLLLGTRGISGAMGRRGLISGRGGMRRGDEDFGDGDEDFGDGYGAGSILATANRKVEWRAGISVRMIVDLREQRKKIREALHIMGDFRSIQEHVDYQQIHIERMQRQDGAWGDWEEVKLEDIGEVLLESLGQDVDIVSPVVTRPELTMPLPRRATGQWLDDEVSHSMIVDFELSPEEQEMQNRIDAMMQADADREAAYAPPVRKPKKGFTPFLTNRIDLRSRAVGNNLTEEQYKEQALKEMEEAYKRLGKEFDEHAREVFLKQFEATATADDRLLLVRFIDFTAERGFAYRYRVRLEMYNPNFQQLPDDLVSPEIGDQETIVSDWSEPTPASYVPMRYRNYARKVKLRNGQHVVDFGVYYEEDGVLPVMGTVSVEVGMPIAGQHSEERVDLEKQVLEAGEVTFITNELLGGVLPSPRLDSRDHSDLGDVLRKFGRRSPVDHLVSVVDTRGDIVLRHASENSHQADKQLVDAIILNYEIWRPGRGRGGLFGDEEFDGDGGDEDFGDEGFGGGKGRGMRPGSALGPASRGGRGAARGRGGRGGKSRN